MRSFLTRALNKLAKLDPHQIQSLMMDLSRENDLMSTILDSIADGIAVLNEEGKAVYVNKIAEKLLPLTWHEIYDHPLFICLSDDEVAAFIRDSAGSGSDIKEQEFSYDLAGSCRTVHYTLYPIKTRLLRGRVLKLEDLTIKLQEEARLHRAESLAKLTSLAAGVAHEIKNPLASLGIHVQIMQKELEKEEAPDKNAFKGYLGVMGEEIERLNGIVVDFLFAVRPMDTKKRLSNLNEVVRELAEFIRFEMEENNIKIILCLDERLPDIMLDGKFIKQALLNLVQNSRAAMPKGGTLTFKTQEEGGVVHLSIQDTGLGISQENLHKIFEPYFTTKAFGTGLGLTMVYKIVKEHSGDIAIRSRENQGTTFTLQFPIPSRNTKLLSADEDSGNIVFIGEDHEI
ncbi:MAG: PAS domain S-box protein [Spirochaetales bacterium]|jgi:PAS domain S-box-containing protein|nr:PAS domain S-box protein [Spirochaetales bacterium]